MHRRRLPPLSPAHIGLAAFTAALMGPAAARAELAEGPVTGELSGYIESRHHLMLGLDPDFDALAGLFPDGFHPEHSYGAVERLRPTLKLHLGESATFVSTAEAHADHGFFDSEQRRMGQVVAVERLYVTASLGAFDHTAGKQNVAWGSGLLLNPTDLFNDKNPADLQAERPGVWALRTLYAVNDHTNVTFVAATPEEPCCAPTLIARWDTTLGITDLAMEGAYAAPGTADAAAVLGADLRTELHVGLWLEAATTVPIRDGEPHPGAAKTSLEAGLDYSFDVLQTLFLAAEYMYQQAGLSEPGKQLDAGSLAFGASPGGSATLGGASPAGGVADAFTGAFADRRMFMGRHYGVALARLEINGEWRAQVLNVTNAVDGTGLVVPQVSFLPAEAWTFTLGAQLAYGADGGEYTLTLPELTPAQERILPLADPRLGPGLVKLQGARLVPETAFFLWGRHAF